MENVTRKIVQEYRRLFRKCLTEGILSLEDELPYSDIPHFKIPLLVLLEHLDAELSYEVFRLILKNVAGPADDDTSDYYAFLDDLAHHFFLRSGSLSDMINDLGLFRNWNTAGNTAV
jgi:hypothetical protein